MTVTYITDLLNHHLIPLAQEFFARIGDDFHLIETKDPRVGDYYQKGYAFYAAKTQADREFPGGCRLISRQTMLWQGSLLCAAMW